MIKEVDLDVSLNTQTEIEYGSLHFKISKSDFIARAIKEYAKKKGVSLPEDVRLTRKNRSVLTAEKNCDNTIKQEKQK